MTVMSRLFTQSDGAAVAVENPYGSSDVILICEHASNTIPDSFSALGLEQDVLASHIAWDPGALAVSMLLSVRLDATLVYQRFSRLIYDCNRPPSAAAAMPQTSEIYNIPGNSNLAEAERYARTSAVYIPFHDRIAGLIHERMSAGRKVAVVTVHSFTPVYFGQKREVGIGILHDDDSRLADAMLAAAQDGSAWTVRRNEPYGPQDGVTHTLRLHAIPEALPNVMIEIRNDLIADAAGQERAAGFLGDILNKGLASLE